MSYQKQTFIDYPNEGYTIIKAEHLTHIEEGIVNLEKEIDFQKNGRNVIRIANLNCGKFGYLPEGMTDEEALVGWYNLLGQSGYDILGCQEWDYLYPTLGTEAVSTIIGNSADVISGNNGNYKLASKLGALTKLENLTLDGDYASFNTVLRGSVQFGGKTIYLYNCHCTPSAGAAPDRQRQYASLIADCQDKEYYIILGDFNAWSFEEYQIFIDAGMRLANGGYLGRYYTLRNEVCADNIIVSNNIKIKEVGVMDTSKTNTDHMLIYADLIL